MVKRIAGALFLCSTLILLSCGDDATTVVTPADLLIVSGDGQTGTVGEALSQEVTVQVVDADDQPISGVDVTFETDNGSVSPATATTSAQGQASTTWTLGTTAGSHQATATADGVSANFSATAEAAEAASVAISPAAPDTFTALDATTQLSANAEDTYGNAVTGVTWTSSDDAVATVDGSGLITAVSNGTAQIAASSGSAADTVDVVVDQQASDVSITGATDRLVWAETLQLDGSAVDANGNPVAGSTMTWSSGDTSTASVDTSGLVTGEGVGTVDIIATLDAFADTFAVTVTPVPDASMSNSYDHGCLLDETGAAYCWGANGAGQLGDGTNDYSNTPVAVSGGHQFVALAPAHYQHQCALTDTGTAYCWGLNDHGQLGDGGGANSNVPVAVSGGMTFDALTSGFLHTCGLDPDGNGYCWGRNAEGQLGDGTTTSRSTPTAMSTTLTFDDLNAGGYHTCALNGTQGYCWGQNTEGQIGDGTTASPRTTPVSVAGGLELATISAGAVHTCGMTTSGAPYCWGANVYGAVGDGTTDQTSSPTAVSDLATVDQISAGFYISCAIASETDYCWGYNGYGALGDGTLTNRATPSQVVGGISWVRTDAGFFFSCGTSADGTPYCWGYSYYVGDGSSAEQPTPVQVAGGHTFTNVSAGDDMTCAATGTPDAYCWGNNGEGQLGITDSTRFKTTPTQITEVALEQVASGYEFGCGLAADGTAYCWGENLSGQLGTGASGDTAVAPVAVDAAFTFSDITVGQNHACGIRASDGTAYCWGENDWGQLGDGTTTDRLSPQLVSGGHSFASIGAGRDHTCAVAGTGTTYCWGYNANGQLGDATNTDRTTPTTVAGGLGFDQVTTGFDHSCGVTVGDQAYCWGANFDGQLGDGSTTAANTPQAVTGGVSFDMLDAGYWHTCGVGTSGTAYCWGAGNDGQIGNGSLADQTSPTPIQGGYTMASISGGDEHSCAITTGGDTYCWGTVGFGQLGDGSSVVTDPTPVAGSHTIVTSPLTSATTTFGWGGSTRLGEPAGLTARELRAIQQQMEQLGLPTGDPFERDEEGIKRQ
ncbi:MAG: Ig-like domain-containing protein [Longimicrobiales bacterium]